MGDKKRLKKYDPDARKREYADIRSIAEEFYSRIPSLTSNFYLVYNFQSRKIIHITHEIEEILGTKPKVFYRSPESFLELIEPGQKQELSHYYKQTELFLYTKRPIRTIVINWQFGVVTKHYRKDLLIQIYPLVLEFAPKYLMVIAFDLSKSLGLRRQGSYLRHFILDKDTNRLIHFEEKSTEAQDLDIGLTSNEKKVYELVNDGLKSQEIADQLGLTYLTVKTHRRNINAKLKRA